MAFAGVVLAANGYAERREEWGWQGRIVRPGWIYRIPVAQIANDLAPLIDNLPGKNGGTPRVIGYDGQYIRDAPGALAIFGLPRDAGNDGELESLSAGFETFHPVLFHGAEGERAMWQEGEHRPESRYAHNVIWDSPEAVRGKRVTEYERYRDKTERVIASIGGERLPAPTARYISLPAFHRPVRGERFAPLRNESARRESSAPNRRRRQVDYKALTSLLAIGFISATSMLLANALGSAVYARENENSRHGSDDAARLRKQIASFPDPVPALYGLFSSLVAVKLFEQWNLATVLFACLYIAPMARIMAQLRSQVSRVFSGDDRLEP